MSDASRRDPALLVEAIEADIYKGVLAPGMWLKQIDLEERYGCTRLAVRHALETLQSRKVITRVRNRGYYVPPVDEAAMNEIMQARALVETSIVDILVANVADDSLARLGYLATVYADTLRNGTLSEQDEANHDFHRELLKSCPNKVVVEIIWDLRMRIPVLAQRTYNTPSRLERSAREHFEMVEALRLRDGPRLADVISRHVTVSEWPAPVS